MTSCRMLREVRKEIGTNGEALQEHRRTLRIIDDALDALPAADEPRGRVRGLVEPEDMVPICVVGLALDHDAIVPCCEKTVTPDLLRLSLVQKQTSPFASAARRQAPRYAGLAG